MNFFYLKTLLTDKNYMISRSARTCPDRSVRNDKAYSGFRRLVGRRRHAAAYPLIKQLTVCHSRCSSFSIGTGPDAHPIRSGQAPMLIQFDRDRSERNEES